MDEYRRKAAMERQGVPRPTTKVLPSRGVAAGSLQSFLSNKHNRADISGGAELLIINQAYKYDMTLEWQERLVNNRVET